MWNKLRCDILFVPYMMFYSGLFTHVTSSLSNRIRLLSNVSEKHWFRPVIKY